MSRLTWDKTGERLYETGVSKGVLYLESNGTYPRGVAWNGLTAVTEQPSGAEATPLYADDIKYLNLISVEEFGASIEAYTYPDEFAQCDGSAEIATGVVIGQQPRKTFGFCYRTILGNDTENEAYGYKLHLVYGAKAAPSEKAYATVNDSPEAISLSWELTTTPVQVNNAKPTACITIDSTKTPSDKLSALEDILYGTNSSDPRLPLPDEIALLMGNSDYVSVSYYLTNVTSSNNDTVVEVSDGYAATLTANSGYDLANVIVIVNGVDVTSTKYSNGDIELAAADLVGNVVIIATATETV